MSDIGIDLTANDEEAQFALGTVMELKDDEGSKKYRYVKFHEGASPAVAGEVAGFANVATAGDATGTIVTSDWSVTDDVGAGVLQAVLTDAYHGWIQVTGYALLTVALDTGADGDALTPDTATTDGSLGVVTALTDAVCAYAIDVSAKTIMCAFPH